MLKERKINTKYFKFYWCSYGLIWVRVLNGYGMYCKWKKKTFLYSERNSIHCLNLFGLIVFRFLKPKDHGRIQNWFLDLDCTFPERESQNDIYLK